MIRLFLLIVFFAICIAAAVGLSVMVGAIGG